ncbi:MAG: diaminopimelate epimerase [Chitinispirillaceae bacterium]|nr:diaminopimelate epimerase [Chitinispirillaceae bacterium]
MKHTLSFMKMHGLGNDFIVTHEMEPGEIPAIQNHTAELCDRRRGIGADGVILIRPSDNQNADFRMRIFNSDGSEAEMCGNGIRCCAQYVRLNNLSAKQSLVFQTGAGPIATAPAENGLIRVTMSNPVLDAALIPTTQKKGRVIMQDLQVDERTFAITAVSMGNPHAVIYADELSDDLVQFWGRNIETHPFFPKKTNVEFVTVLSDREIRMRVWERGCGETLACGTGACASVVSGIVNNLHGNEVTVRLLGGDLAIEWDGNEHSPVFMTGPARLSFTGRVEVPL